MGGCDVCGRSFLPGERSREFASPDGRRAVCELCVGRAERAGWRPWEDVGEEGLPVRRPRRRIGLGALFGRGRRERPADREPGVVARYDALEDDLGAVEEAEPVALPEAEHEPEPTVDAYPDPEPDPRPRRRPDPAAPGRTTGRIAADASPRSPFERGLERFNASEAPRTVAGLARTLGAPWVSVGAVAGAAHEVRITVAWELCWYQWGVDLDDELRPVFQIDKGQELEQLDAAARQWNARAGEGGRIALAAGRVAEPAER